MINVQLQVAALIERARQGDAEALGTLLEQHRPYLRLLALRTLDRRLAGRIDASDVVQQTCISACRKIEEFSGENPAQFAAWLREIHERNIHNAFRDHMRTQKRSLQHEQPGGGEAVGNIGDTSAYSPSRRAMLSEDAVRLAAALAELTEDQATAVRLKFLEGWSLTETAEALGKTPDAAVSLIRRGLIRLREILKDMSDE